MAERPTVPELTIDLIHRTTLPGYGERLHTHETNPLVGYNAVFELNGKWFGYNESNSGSSRRAGHATREEAEQDLRDYYELHLSL